MVGVVMMTSKAVRQEDNEGYFLDRTRVFSHTLEIIKLKKKFDYEKKRCTMNSTVPFPPIWIGALKDF